MKLIITFLILSISIFILSSFNKPKLTYVSLKYDKSKFNKPIIPIDNPLTFEGISLGRLLFYDTILSSDYTISCGSCHKQEHSFTDAGVKYSRGVNGNVSRRNTMSLVNLVWQTSFFWDGRANTLEDVIHFPIMDTLEMNIDTTILKLRLQKHLYYPKFFKKVFNTNEIQFVHISKAIAQFLRTINTKSYGKDFKVMFEYFKKNENNNLKNENSLAGMYYRTINTCGKCHTGEGRGNTKFANNLVTKNDSNSRYKII